MTGQSSQPKGGRSTAGSADPGRVDTDLTADPRLRLGISSCLLGEEVRFDGGHKRDGFLVETLGQYVEWVPLCPEVEIGLGTPRESLRLVGVPQRPRMIGQKSGQDFAEKMQAWARSRLKEIETWDLCGYVVKKDSPSCGLFRVRVYNEQGVPTRNGQGIFARELHAHLPLLPLEEEGRLRDPRLRENFIERIFAYQRWRQLLRDEPTAAGLVKFHTAHKLTVLSHSPQHYQSLGRLVAEAGKRTWEELAASYSHNMAKALSTLATRGRHANVLQHLMGFLKESIDGKDRSELLELIEEFRRGRLPLIVPVTLLKHHLRRHAVPDWVHQQAYLNPYPKELMLRNHV